MTLRRMLAVTHEASLTGAPIVLADLLSWIAANSDVGIHTLVLRDGPLRTRFAAVGDITVLPNSGLGGALELAERGLAARGSRRVRPLVSRLRLAPRLRHLRDYDLIYLNSLTSLEVLPHLPPAGQVVSHIHELQMAVQLWERTGPAELLRHGPDEWIAASGAVRRMLVEDVGAPAEHVHLHHACIDAQAIAARRVPLREVEQRRRALGIPRDAAVVMGAGTIEWRKAPDLFVQLACEIRRRTSDPVHFVWVGGDLDGPDWVKLRCDIERTGADHVHIVGEQPDPISWFHLADVFVLTSHEDPFPLVVQEHAALGHPVVTFRNGGIVELLEAAGPDVALNVVDHLDTVAMADRVMELLESEELRRRAGLQLRRRVLSHHDVSVAAPRLLYDLERMAAREALT